MYCVALAVTRIPDTLPVVAYAFLSGLNAAVVGLIAVSAVILSEKAIGDHLTRCIVIGTACAGLLYSTLVVFPSFDARRRIVDPLLRRMEGSHIIHSTPTR